MHASASCQEAGKHKDPSGELGEHGEDAHSGKRVFAEMRGIGSCHRTRKNSDVRQRGVPSHSDRGRQDSRA